MADETDKLFFSPTAETKPPALKDRRSRLRVMGVVQFLLAGSCFVAMLILLLAVALQNTLLKGSDRPTPSAAVVIMPIIVFAGCAGFFIWVGLGSLRCRRWVRPVILSVMWPTLVLGLLALLGLLFMLPSLFDMFSAITIGAGLSVPEAFGTVILVFSVAFTAILYIGIPGLHVLMYQEISVKNTCFVSDPVERWTDRVPLSILGISIWLTVYAVWMLAMIPLNVTWLFGLTLSGPGAIVVFILQAAIAMVVSILICRQKKFGWWAGLVFMPLLFINIGVSLMAVDIGQVYLTLQLMPASQVRQMEPFFVEMGKLTALPAFACAVGTVVHMVLIKKRFTH